MVERNADGQMLVYFTKRMEMTTVNVYLKRGRSTEWGIRVEEGEHRGTTSYTEGKIWKWEDFVSQEEEVSEDGGKDSVEKAEEGRTLQRVQGGAERKYSWNGEANCQEGAW